MILADVEADQLPVHYGGTQTGPNNDPKCCNKVIYMVTLFARVHMRVEDGLALWFLHGQT